MASSYGICESTVATIHNAQSLASLVGILVARMSVYLLVFTPLGGLLSSFILCLFFWRSSPMWPKTLHQLWIELLFQYYGFRAFIEDKWFQKANFVGKLL